MNELLDVSLALNIPQMLTQGATPSRTKSPDPLSKERDDVHKLVSDLIGGSPVSSHTTTSSTPPNVTTSPAAPVTSSPGTTAPAAAKRTVKLVVEPLAPIVIRPKVSGRVLYTVQYVKPLNTLPLQEVEVYVKATQTDAVALEPHRPGDDEDEDEAAVEVLSSQPVAPPPEPAKVQCVDCLYVNQWSLSGVQDKGQLHHLGLEMSAEQRDKIIASDEFLTFFDRASRLVERALCSPSDILFDYISGSGEEGRLGLWLAPHDQSVCVCVCVCLLVGMPWVV